MKKNGISLIVLVITIVIIIILAGAVILNLADKNPIKDATQAVVMEDIDTYRSDLILTLSNMYQNSDFSAKSVNATTKDDIVKYVPSMEGGKIGGTLYTDILVVSEGELKVDAEKANEKIESGKLSTEQYSWVVEALGDNVLDEQVGGVTVADVKADPETYYGAYVNYVPKNGCNVKWRVFYADDTNIYLIAEDYVPNSFLAATGLATDGDYYVYSETDRQDLVTKLTTSSYYTDFKDNAGKASSVVGAPTLEQFKTSYNAVNTDTAKQMDILNCTENQAVTPGIENDDDNNADADGYVLRFGNTGNYVYYQIMPADANKRDLYIGTDSTNAAGMWLASFSASSAYKVMYAYCDGLVAYGIYEYSDDYLGLRPLVTLNSNVKLVDQDGDGTYDLE